MRKGNTWNISSYCETTTTTFKDPCAIDPEIKLDWNREDGRWMCMAALLSIKSMNGQDHKAAGQPVQGN